MLQFHRAEHTSTKRDRTAVAACFDGGLTVRKLMLQFHRAAIEIFKGLYAAAPRGLGRQCVSGTYVYIYKQRTEIGPHTSSIHVTRLHSCNVLHVNYTTNMQVSRKLQACSLATRHST